MLKCERKSWAPGGCLCRMPVAPAHRIFVNAFRSGYNCALCQNHKAHCGAAEREHWGESDPGNPVSLPQEESLRGWAQHFASWFLTVFQSPFPRTRFKWRLVLQRFSKISFNPGLGKWSILNWLQSSGHHFHFLCHVNETFWGCIISWKIMYAYCMMTSCLKYLNLQM